jgi:ATP-dependent DNA helicase RecG
MKPIDLQSLISQQEIERLEFKLAKVEPRMVARVVCGFLNQRGGWLLVGVDDSGRVVGVPDAQKLVSTIEGQLPKLISPRALWTIDTVRSEKHDVIVIEVPEGSDKPYVSGGAIYVRSGPITTPATSDEIRQLIVDRRDTSQRWERQLVLGVDQEDLDESLIRVTIQKARAAQRWLGKPSDTEAFLHDFGLAESGRLTNAALVLFGKIPTRLLPQARVRLVLLADGKTADNYTLDKAFDGCLLRTAQEIPSVLESYAGGVESSFTSQEWQRSDRARYPLSALREGVMNAMVHRDYQSNGAVQIAISPESVRISNPGGLPDELKLADLKREHLSLPRNPDIAHVCFLNGLIEKLGRGTQRIVEDCQKARLREPKWTSSKLETSLTLYSAPGADQQELTDRQTQILAALKDEKGMKAIDLANYLGERVTDRTVRNDLQILIDLGRVVRQNRGPGTVYKLVPKEKKRK